jgi:tRNA 2-thiouridine synthesizing protein A
VSGPVVVDARGLRCPQPVVAVARAAAGLPDGAVLVLLADDPAAVVDVPAWAWLRGHAVQVTEEDAWRVYTVRVGEAPEDEPVGGREKST